MDSAGNVYAVGWTSGAFGGFTNAGGYDGFARSYTRAGSVGWTQQFGPASDDTATGTAVDKSGNVYAGGYTPGTFNGFTNAGGVDSFLAKIAPAP